MFDNSQIRSESLPKIEKVQFEALHPNYKKVILLNIILFCLISLVSVILFFHFTNEITKIIKSIYVYLGLFSFFVFLLISYFVSFSRRKYAIRGQDISYKKGVLRQSMITVPFNRIQHIEIDEGLFSRMFKLASINIYTAGANNLDLAIKGLPKETAEKTKEFINSKINA